ncbi:MAG: PAS domain S-box protein [Ignavibacteriae bacterium]|nr:MAG: PAS domain S-box protein [Ignavibacteriota bacterium]
MNKLIQLFQLEKSHIRYLFIVALLILFSANLVSFMNARDLEELQSYTSLTITNVKLLEDMRDKITAAQSGRQFYFISNDKSYITPYNNVSSSIDTIYSRLRVSTKDNNTVQYYLDTLSSYIKMRFDLMNRGIELQARNGNTYKTVITMMNDGKELTVKIMHLVTAAQEEEFRSLKNNIEVTNSKSAFTKYILISGSTFSIFILIFTFIAATKIYSQGGNRSNKGKLTQDELETIVRERTAEISQINNRLYKTIEKYEKAEVELKKKEKDYRLLFEQAHDAILIFDVETAKILDVNERACSLYLIPKNSFVGLSMKMLVKNVPETEKRIKLTVEKGYCNNFQTVHYRKDGMEMLIEINGSLISYQGKKAIISINRDITERILNLIPLPGS